MLTYKIYQQFSMFLIYCECLTFRSVAVFLAITFVTQNKKR